MATENPGRNLTMEVDQVNERLTRMDETQTRIEAILTDMRQTQLDNGNQGTFGQLNNDNQGIQLNNDNRGSGTGTQLNNGNRGLGAADAVNNENPVSGTHGQPRPPPFVLTAGGVPVMTSGTQGVVHVNPLYVGEGYPNLEGNPTGMGYDYGWENLAGAQVERERQRDELLQRLQEQMRALQTQDLYNPTELHELCPSNGVTIPRDFKLPDFAKYNGTTNPLHHLKAYCTKMVVWSRDENFLINFFHESLTGPALEWYIQLDHSKITRWKTLADLFMAHYRFNMEVAPTREQLSAQQKKNDETFRQYAQKWRSLAAQVQPPLTATEMCSYFLGTLEGPYIPTMAGAAYKDFADLIVAGERIEMLAKAGKIPSYNGEGNGKKTFPIKKKENDVNKVSSQFPVSYQIPPPYPNLPPYQTPAPCQPTSQMPPPFPMPSPYPAPRFRPPQPYTVNPIPPASTPQYQVNNIPVPRPYVPNQPYNPPQNRFPNRPNQNNQNRMHPNLPPFPKLPITNEELFQKLYDAHLIAISPVRPMQPPFPAWYNPHQTCKYHMGVAGHSTEDCDAFKGAVRKLIGAGVLDIQNEGGPSITNNPLPSHGNNQ